MEDDETRMVSGGGGDPGPRQPWNTPYEGYVSRGLSDSSHGEEMAYGYQAEPWSHDPSRRPYQPQGSSPQPRKGRGGAWVLPVILVVLALAAFGMVLFLLKGHDTKTPAADRSVATQSSSSAAPSSSASSASESYDDFPQGASKACLAGTPDSHWMSESTESDIRFDDTHQPSCGYVTEVKTAVSNVLSRDPHSTSFEIDPYSSYKQGTITLSCTRKNHLTTCTGGDPVVTAYVKDQSS